MVSGEGRGLEATGTGEVLAPVLQSARTQGSYFHKSQGCCWLAHRQEPSETLDTEWPQQSASF